MKKFFLLLPLLLAACSPSKPANPVAASVETISAAVSELSETAPAVTTFPVSFQGRWDADQAACKLDSSDMRLTIEEKALRFWESGGEVKAVTVATPDDITAQVAMSGEGEQWDKTLHMVLSNGGNTLTIDDGKTGVRVRCA